MTVARAIQKAMPGYQLLYYGDLARTPYGSKSSATIIDYSIQNTEFLLDHGAKIVVIACNTASSAAADVLRERYSVPIFEVITPAVQKAAELTRNLRTAVIGTRATIRSKVYERKLKELSPNIQVFSQECPLLVPLVEEGWLNQPETKMVLRKYLFPLKQQQVDTLVLGCTHYPLLKELIRPRIGKRVTIIDSSETVAEALHEFLVQHPIIAATLPRGQEDIFYVSDWTPTAQEIAQRIFGHNVDLIKV